jgi:hypothetical protein
VLEQAQKGGVGHVALDFSRQSQPPTAHVSPIGEFIESVRSSGTQG